jgi:NhaA family Na+:H+ antiporter
VSAARDDRPPAPIHRITRPIQEFLHVEASSGFLLACCAGFALLAANSPWSEAWTGLWETRLTLGLGSFVLDYPLWYWINDALMAVFFFLVGLEIKRELVLGELREPAARALPVAAALGGALVPALIYLIFHHSGPAARGWGVPMATDIAFVVGILALFGSRVPPALKLFLLSLAIVDDLLAVVIIALFYSTALSWPALGLAALVFLGMAGLRAAGVRSLAVYWAAGSAVWLCTLKSGIHPTIAGVALGLLTPVKPLLPLPAVERLLQATRERLTLARGREKAELVRESAGLLREAVSPVRRLEDKLHPWVAFGIMPLFALANAGIPIATGEMLNPVAQAVALALVIGKPLGIVGAAALLLRLTGGRLPEGLNWRILCAGACLGGVGFTMSLFIAGLGLPAEFMVAGKTGVLFGSLIAGAVGVALLARSLPRKV